MADLRSWLRPLHRWVGLILVLPAVLLAGTGAVLTWQRDLDRWSHPALFSPPLPSEGESAPALTADEILARLHAYDARPLVALTVPDAVWPVWVATVRAVPLAKEHTHSHAASASSDAAAPRPKLPEAPQSEIFLDPLTGQILGERDRDSTVLRVIRRLHSTLLWGDTGRCLIGWGGVLLVLLQLTGMVVWWPKAGRWRTAITVRPGARGRRLLLDLHNVSAIWLWLVLLMIGLTGITMCFNQTTRALLGLPPSVMRMGVPVLPPDTPYPVTASQALAIAQAARPVARVISLRPAGREQAVWTLTLRDASGAMTLTETMRIDAQSGAILPSPPLSPAQFYINEQRSLHYGQSFGVIGRVLVCTTGGALLCLSVTGLLAWNWQRRARAKAAMA